MSEEEKKAIDYLKNDVVYWLDKGKDFVVIDIGENEKLHSILNLIEKQQKEIEHQREQRKLWRDNFYKQEKEIKELKKDFISKYKIRKK